MSDDRIDRILEKLKEKLRKKEVPETATGRIIINLQSGGVSGDAKLELTL
jgi:hypothetical protein